MSRYKYTIRRVKNKLREALEDDKRNDAKEDRKQLRLFRKWFSAKYQEEDDE